MQQFSFSLRRLCRSAWQMPHQQYFVLLVLIWLAVCVGIPASAAPAAVRPPVMLASLYRPGIALAGYWVSEKFDGVRAYWDGRQLLTRGGETIHVPVWFTAGWPSIALDGELWAGRGQFAQAVSTARRQTPSDAAWRRMRYLVFDLPQHGGTFDQRLTCLTRTVRQIDQVWVQRVEHVKVADHAALQVMLEQTVAQGGEGLMLHRGAARYRAARSDDLLKFKPYVDTEAKVVGYTPGKGKYTGMVGALLVETAQGLRFKLGSGLSDAQRRQPPAVGSLVTYRYRGFHDSGIPRFAVFLRVRKD